MQFFGVVEQWVWCLINWLLLNATHFRTLNATVESLQKSGILIVASAGNKKLPTIPSDLNNGTAIIVGSHGKTGIIGEFSNGKCTADICTLGEELIIKTVRDSKRSGTTYACAQVSAMLANFHVASSQQLEAKYIKARLRETSDNVICRCGSGSHNEEQVKRKLNKSNFLNIVRCWKANSCETCKAYQFNWIT